MLGLRLVPSPTVDWYLRFSPGFTALSLFAPLVAFALAFIFLGSQAEFSIWRVVLTGVAVGGTIALMHVSTVEPLPSHPFVSTNCDQPLGAVASETQGFRAKTRSFSLFFPSTRHPSPSHCSCPSTPPTPSSSPSSRLASQQQQLSSSSFDIGRTGRTPLLNEDSHRWFWQQPFLGCITSLWLERLGRSGWRGI